MQVKNETIKVISKTRDESKQSAVKVGDNRWLNASRDLLAKLVWKNTYNVEIIQDDKGKETITKIVEAGAVAPTVETRAVVANADFAQPAKKEFKTGDFRSPDQIIRSTAIGVAASYIAESLKMDQDISRDEKSLAIFVLAKKIEEYIKG